MAETSEYFRSLSALTEGVNFEFDTERSHNEEVLFDFTAA
jgi:hypothetical protein